MKTVKYNVTFQEKASRLELFIRWLWMIPTYIVYIFVAIAGVVAMFLQWFHILIFGRRNKTLHDWTMKFLQYAVKFMSYFYLVTEERNPIMPED